MEGVRKVFHSLPTQLISTYVVEMLDVMDRKVGREALGNIVDTLIPTVWNPDARLHTNLTHEVQGQHLCDIGAMNGAYNIGELLEFNKTLFIPAITHNPRFINITRFAQLSLAVALIVVLIFACL